MESKHKTFTDIPFGDMKDRSKKLYEALWGDSFSLSDIGAEIEGTTSARYPDPSKNSYRFTCGTDQPNRLIELFGITSEPVFREKYKMAVSGSGGEDKRILTLHSSSLCALLHFYNVTENNPLVISGLKTSKTCRTVSFTNSVFEYKSQVINNPSNMDVVLIGEDTKTKEQIVFFLESKFSEYYMGSTKSLAEISSKYLTDTYTKYFYGDSSFMKAIGLRMEEDQSKGIFALNAMKDAFYIGGIKQMISHYCGMRNLLDKDSILQEAEGQETVTKAVKDGAIILLGEILFDDRIGALEVRPKVNCLKSYQDKYTILAKRIAHLTKDIPRFEMVMNDLGYYSLFKNNDHIIEDRIRRFYREA